MIEFGVPGLLEFAIIGFEVTRGARGETARSETARFGQAQVSTRFVIDEFFSLERFPDGSKQEPRACLGTMLSGAKHQVRFGFEKSWFQVSPTINTVTSVISTIAP
jgi:hypothetical protein